MSANILILEDDKAMARVIRLRLEADGHRVRLFAEAAAALDEIERGASFEIYLLDVKTSSGELSGLTLAHAISARFPDAPIIFMTGDPYLVPEAARRRGAVFGKPIDFAGLRQEIARRLAGG
jgi:DNA-binding NtrC family response regulator